MNVLICGAGQVGLGIAESLAAEGNNVSIIDSDPALVQRANDILDVRATAGNGAHPDVLARAGANEAEMLIAVTLYDEVNMVACQVADRIFNIPTKIARIRAQSYLSNEWSELFGRDAIPIDQIISPEVEVGNTVLRRLELPGAFETATFDKGQVSAIGIACGPECPVLDTPMHQLTDLFPDLPATIVAVVRSNVLFLPSADERLIAGDDAYVVVPTNQIARTLKLFGHEEQQARRVVIAGGGNIGLYVARQIEKRYPNIRVKLIEANRERATEVAERLTRSAVLHGSCLSEELLREAEVPAAETMVAVTNDDQVNILASLLAKQMGCKSSLCLVNSPRYSTLIRSLGIDAQVNPRAVTTSRILQFVRRGRIRGVHSVHNGAGELIEAEALETTAVVGRPIQELGLSDGVKFGAIVRNGEIIVPTGETELQSKDHAILFARADHVRDVEQLFSVRPDFF
ncbi:MAG: Trk system potassium uptake protein TrkA [Pseudomonadota bacterium]|jgi:trk system potassium uptake protein TrkA